MAGKVEFPRAGGLTLTVKRNTPTEVLAYLAVGSFPTSFLCFACVNSGSPVQPDLRPDWRDTFALWVGTASFELSADEASQVAELLKIQMPAARAAA